MTNFLSELQKLTVGLVMSKLHLINLLVTILLVHVPCNTTTTRLNVDQLQRIINGDPCKIEDFPFLIQYHRELEGNKLLSCGGTLLTYEWVISAAHCHYAPIPATGTLIVAGISHPHFAIRNSNGTKRHTTLEIPHPDFKKGMKSLITNDLVIAKMESPMPTDNPKIKPAKLPTEAFTKAVKHAVVMGWGSREPSPIDPDLIKKFPDYFHNVESKPVAEGNTLMCVEVPVLQAGECQKHFPKEFKVRNTHLCGEPVDGKDACQGDSGGPLAVEGTLIGVVAAGLGCGQHAYALYTRVDQFYDFLGKNVDGLELPGDEADEDTAEPGEAGGDGGETGGGGGGGAGAGGASGTKKPKGMNNTTEVGTNNTSIGTTVKTHNQWMIVVLIVQVVFFLVVPYHRP